MYSADYITDLNLSDWEKARFLFWNFPWQYQGTDVSANSDVRYIYTFTPKNPEEERCIQSFSLPFPTLLRTKNPFGLPWFIWRTVHRPPADDIEIKDAVSFASKIGSLQGILASVSTLATGTQTQGAAWLGIEQNGMHGLLVSGGERIHIPLTDNRKPTQSAKLAQPAFLLAIKILGSTIEELSQ